MTPLETSLARIERITIAATPAGAVDYALLDDLRDSWSQWQTRLDAALNTLAEQLLAYAVVRTPSIAVTVISWTGDVQTVWSAGISADLARIHQQELTRATAARANLLRVLLASTKLLAAITVAYANPLYTAGAVKAAWTLLQELETTLA